MGNIELLTEALIASIPAEKLAEVDSFVAVEARGFVLGKLVGTTFGQRFIAGS